jgi:hypothetical protein
VVNFDASGRLQTIWIKLPLPQRQIRFIIEKQGHGTALAISKFWLLKLPQIACG